MGAGRDALHVARAEPEKSCGLAEITQPNLGQQVTKHLASVRVFPLMCRHDLAPQFVHLTLRLMPIRIRTIPR